MRADRAFHKLMEGRNLSPEEYQQAMFWFVQGYKAAVPEKKPALGHRDFMLDADDDNRIRAQGEIDGWNACIREAMS